MKLRYYLRGLGIGILVTAIIFCLMPGRKENLSDEEIRARALELGMVENTSLTLADMQKEQVPEMESVVQAENPKPQESAAPKETEAPKETATPAETTKPVETAKPVETQKPVETTNPQQSTASQIQGTETRTITIQSGASSYTVSKLLEEAGLVADAGKYDTYLCDNGYSRNIRTGTYEIVVGATEEEIAKKITGN